MGTPRLTPKCVNGFSNEQDIANCFAQSFSAACSHNSVVKNKTLFEEFCIRKNKYSKNS